VVHRTTDQPDVDPHGLGVVVGASDFHAPEVDAEDQVGRGVNDRLLDAAELAERWNVPTTWVREATRVGKIPCVRLGRYVRYRAETCDAWLEEQEAGAAMWRKHRPRTPSRNAILGLHPGD
jgi:excisionase family DNA binding protein